MSNQDIDPTVTEVVTLDGKEVKYENTDFATVVFHNVGESYPLDADIECRYTVTPDLVLTAQDWVGLYKVGWMSPRDYVYYEWAQIPTDYKVGCEFDASVRFPAHKLPKDDGNFYQFCYVSSSNQIRGASTPFQFHRPGADDFVELEDEEDAMLVIRSKTMYLQEVIEEAEVQKKKLLEVQEVLQKERDDLMMKCQKAKAKLVFMETDNTTLKEKLIVSEANLEQMKHEARDMNVLREELELKIDRLKKEKSALEATTMNIIDKLTSAQSDIKKLQRENDELLGNNAALLEKMDTYQKHVATSETMLAHYMAMSDNVQIQLAKQDTVIGNLNRTVVELNSLLAAAQSDLEQQRAINMHDKVCVHDLEEHLKNAEDKRTAMEESKKTLQREIATFQEIIEQHSKQVERSETECDSAKQKLSTLLEDFKQKTKIQKSEMKQMQNNLQSAIQEKANLQEENTSLLQRLSLAQDRSDLTQGSLSVMQKSLQQITDRLKRKEKQCRSLEKFLQTTEHEFKIKEDALNKEISEMQQKVLLCYEQYKTVYIEKCKLQRKINKMTHRNKQDVSTNQITEQDVSANQITEQDVSANQITEQDVSANQIIEQVNDLEKELNKKLMKMEKYKNLYFEGKDKLKEIVDCHEKEMKKKMDEIEKLKKRTWELPNDMELKLRALEKCVTEKETEIQRLNEMLRKCNLERTEQTGKNKSPSHQGHGYLRYPHQQPSTYGDIVTPVASSCAKGTPVLALDASGLICTCPNIGLLQYPSPPGMSLHLSMAPPPTEPPRESLSTCYPPNTKGQYRTPYWPHAKLDQCMEDIKCDATLECEETFDVLDRPENQLDMLDQLLTPLQAPSEPEKLPSPKAAAAKCPVSSKTKPLAFIVGSKHY